MKFEASYDNAAILNLETELFENYQNSYMPDNNLSNKKKKNDWELHHRVRNKSSLKNGKQLTYSFQTRFSRFSTNGGYVIIAGND